MRKVLYIGGFEMPDKNAAAQRVLANAMTLREIGFDVSFIGPTKDRKSVVAELNGFKCEYIDYPKNLYQWIKYIISFVSSSKILDNSPDCVILYNFPAIASLKVLRICRRKGIKVIHDLTEWESSTGWSPRELIRKLDINLRMHYCVKKMDGVIAISKYLYKYYSRYTRTILVPPTVDISNPKFERCRKLIVNNPIQLVYAGSIGSGNKERLDYIIDSVSKERTMNLTIVGATAEEYEKVYGPLPNFCNNITFKGRLSHQEAVKIVCDSDFQLLIRDNSLKNKAGFPTKFVESMTCCTPIIASVTSNICEFLVDGKTGFILDEKKSLNDILQHISQIDSKTIINMKENCRNFVGFDYRSYKDEFVKLFL